MNLTRRSFVGNMGAGVAALGTIGAAAQAPSQTATPIAPDAKLVYMPGDWHAAEFEKLTSCKARVKQVFDVDKLDGGQFLSPVKNSFNGLHFGYNIPADQIKIVIALRGQPNLMNFDDSMWEKYRLGEIVKVDDPLTSKPATRNIFFPKKDDDKATDPQDRHSIYQDTSLSSLMGRGLVMLSCHNATNLQAQGIVKHCELKVTPEEVVHDLQSHMLPGVISVPAMVAAIAMLQMDGHFTYIAG